MTCLRSPAVTNGGAEAVTLTDDSEETDVTRGDCAQLADAEGPERGQRPAIERQKQDDVYEMLSGVLLFLEMINIIRSPIRG